MKINLRTTNLQLSNATVRYLNKKIGELDKFINVNMGSMDGGREAIEAFVEIQKTTDHHNKGYIFRAEVQIKMSGPESIRAESVKEDVYLAIDEVKNELQGQLRKYKGKRQAKFEKGKRKFKKLLHISELARFKKEK